MQALIIVDVQNDFCPGGSLAVEEGDQIVPLINNLAECFDQVIASQDWHPPGHKSFASQHPGKKPYDVIELNGQPQVLWPDHCVQGSKGAEFVLGLAQEKIHKVIQKGTDKHIDSYSAFYDNGHEKDTGLTTYLDSLNVDTLYVCGIATDYCVKFTVLDALKEEFKTYVIADACRGVEKQEGDCEAALNEMKEKGALIILSAEVLASL